MTHKRGFTLIEIVVALMACIILLSAIYSIFVRTLNINKNHNDLLAMQDSLHLASLQIEQDIRSSSQTITVIQEGNCTSLVDPLKETIRYCVFENTLFRNDVFLIDHIASLSLNQQNPATNVYTIELALVSKLNRKEIAHETTILLRNP